MEPFERLQQARAKAGFQSPKQASDFFGWSEHTYKSHENGNRGIRLAMAHKYAKAFKTTASWILTGEETKPKEMPAVINVPVLSPAAGGAWLEEPDTQLAEAPLTPMVPDPRYDPAAQYARQVVGNSVSNRIKHGEYAIIVRYDAYPGAIPHGKLVDVTRTRNGLTEHTIKAFYGNRLETDSAEEEGQKALELDNGEEGVTVQITGIVIGSFRAL